MNGRARGAARFDDWSLETRALARALLGQTLVRIVDGMRLSGRIVETEAYLGGRDLGSHSAGGRRTPRNESMFLPGGHAYIYFVYGMHHCFNVVSSPVDVGSAVLIRAIEPLEGVEVMARRRGVEPRLIDALAHEETDPASAKSRARRRVLRSLGAGPARLCESLALDRTLDGEFMRTSRRLFIERGEAPARGRVTRGPRIGIDYAGEWTRAPLRFGIASDPFMSRPFS